MGDHYMGWFNNIAFHTKLLFGFGLIILFLIFIIVNAYQTTTTLRTTQKDLYETEFTAAITLKDIRSNQNAIRANLLAMIEITGTAEMGVLEKDIVKRSDENDKNLNMLLNLYRNDPLYFSKLQDFNSVRIEFRETWEKQILPLIKSGRIDDAREILFSTQAERQEKMLKIANELVDIADQTAQDALEASKQLANESVQASATTGSIVILLSVVIFLLLNHVVRKISLEIREGTNVLASAASEIVATTTQVASGAAETATAVSETTTTVEEVKKTAELSSDKARYVSETAQKAMQVSQTGKQAVEQSIEGVSLVRQQMEVLAESIVRLSEQSQAIGEVIATVNDLAEQSNLLAVNAAIEAAKAGEQGKGFGVVAQEIKSLAEQSKQATSQVRTILGDIQKATSASVLAAEQGSKAVESGVKQSAEAGEAIKMLAQSIAEAAQAATQIAASSRQQQVGMDQVAQAMDNIQQATSQNMAGTKQAETAAHNLSELGQKLKGVVEQYGL
jgi:hypothetical protein